MTTELSPAPAFRLRHESKHQILPQEDFVLSRRLRRLFAPDQNAGPDGSYRVTSLYFDNPYDSALREKLDGLGRREKFRLRFYGQDLSFLRLEKKFKLNGLCGKRSLRLTLREALMLLEGRCDFLPAAGDPLALEFYTKLRGGRLRPKTVVRYDREAFCYPPGNVRITLDRGLHTGGPHTFLDLSAAHLPALDGVSILEIKYDAFLPDLVRMAVQVPGRREAACSKYALCRRLD